MHQLDEDRFFSPKILEELDIDMPKLQSTHYAEQHRYTLKSHNSDEVELFNMKEFLHGINTDILRIIFLILDAVLLLYRFSHTYINTSRLCKGFEESVTFPADSLHKGMTNGKSSYKMSNQRRHTPQDQRTSGEHTSLRAEREVHFADNALPGYSVPGKHQGSPMSGAAAAGSGDATSSQHNWSSTSELLDNLYLVIFKHTLAKIILSNCVPKMLISAALVVLIHVVIQTACHVFNIHLLLDVGAFGVFMHGLDVQANQTNAYLIDQARHLNEVAMKTYENQMKSELLNLHSMLQFFNSGECYHSISPMQRPTVVNDYLKSKRLLLFVFACEISQMKHKWGGGRLVRFK